MITNTGTRRGCFFAVFVTLMIGVYGDLVIEQVDREVRRRFAVDVDSSVVAVGTVR